MSGGLVRNINNALRRTYWREGSLSPGDEDMLSRPVAYPRVWYSDWHPVAKVYEGRGKQPIGGEELLDEVIESLTRDYPASPSQPKRTLVA